MVKIRYGNYQKQKAYKNAIQAIYSGYGYSEWDSCGLDFFDADEVWERALADTENLLGRYSIAIPC